MLLLYVVRTEYKLHGIYFTSCMCVRGTSAAAVLVVNQKSRTKYPCYSLTLWVLGTAVSWTYDAVYQQGMRYGRQQAE